MRGLNIKPYTQSSKQAAHCIKAWFGARLKCLVQTLTAKTGICGNRRHVQGRSFLLIE